MRYFILLMILFFWGFSTPFCSAEMSAVSSKMAFENTASKKEIFPVERVRPPEKKAKKKQKRLQKNKKIASDKAQEFNVFTFLAIVFLVVFVTGAFLFGFGIYILPMLIVGLVLMGLSNIIALLLSLFMTVGMDNVSGVGGAVLGMAAFIFAAITGALDFIIGLVFLILGLVLATPIAWIVGVILLALFLILLLFCILAITKL